MELIAEHNPYAKAISDSKRLKVSPSGVLKHLKHSWSIAFIVSSFLEKHEILRCTKIVDKEFVKK